MARREPSEPAMVTEATLLKRPRTLQSSQFPTPPVNLHGIKRTPVFAVVAGVVVVAIIGLVYFTGWGKAENASADSVDRGVAVCR